MTGILYDRRKARRLCRRYGGKFWRVDTEVDGRPIYEWSTVPR